MAQSSNCGGMSGSSLPPLATIAENSSSPSSGEPPTAIFNVGQLPARTRIGRVSSSRITASGVASETMNATSEADSLGLSEIAIAPAFTMPMKATANSARFARWIATRSPIAMPRETSPCARRVDCSSTSPKVSRVPSQATASRAGVASAWAARKAASFTRDSGRLERRVIDVFGQLFPVQLHRHVDLHVLGLDVE